jgi:hypothetical protein
VPDDSPSEERSMALYAAFDTDDYEGVEYGTIEQRVRMGLDNDGVRLCLTTHKDHATD